MANRHHSAEATCQQVVDFSQPLTGEGGGAEGGGDGEVYTYRVNECEQSNVEIIGDDV